MKKTLSLFIITLSLVLGIFLSNSQAAQQQMNIIYQAGTTHEENPDVITDREPCFVDGFESGDTLTWSSTLPADESDCEDEEDADTVPAATLLLPHF